MSSSTVPAKPPLSLSSEAIDDLIYDARSGDLEALKSDIESLRTQHNNCSASEIIASAIDAEPESEGGSGACLLHFPAANGNIEILNFLLQTLTSTQALSRSQILAVINHRNHSGNTPLHWAALNTHLECVKALVHAGADVSIKNDAGHDAVFLAERTAWSTVDEVDVDANDERERSEKGNGKQMVEVDQRDEEVEINVADEQGEKQQQDAPKKVLPAQQVVEWLLSCDQGADLESGVAEGERNGTKAGAVSGQDEMEGVEQTGRP